MEITGWSDDGGGGILVNGMNAAARTVGRQELWLRRRCQLRQRYSAQEGVR